MTTVAEHVDQAAEQLRVANHAIRGPLDGPAAYEVVGNLAVLIGRMPQVLDHLRRSLRRADRDQHYDDRPGVPVGHTVGSAIDHLDEMRGLVDHLDDECQATHNDLGHLGRRITED